MADPRDPHDRLYELLPEIYQLRDGDQGEPLRALLQVIAEQVDVVEGDIGQLYENWFIETCQEWAVPYIGDLIGYTPVHEAGEPGEVTTPQGQVRNKILIPRREVANTIRYRRRKGALALLELLANDVAGWPARAVEFFRLLAWTQHLNHLQMEGERARTVDLRNGDALDLLDGPFDRLAHSVDVRRINSAHTPGRYNIPSVGLFVWRLRVYTMTKTLASHKDRLQGRWTFNILGNDMPLYARCVPETSPTQIAQEPNLPAPIRRRAFEQHPEDYYGEAKSICIWKTNPSSPGARPVPVADIVAADLSDWFNRPQDGKVALDPELGRIVVAAKARSALPQALWVSYRYGFSADMGGGEYQRPLSPDDGKRIYRVAAGDPTSEDDPLKRAVTAWQNDQKAVAQPLHAVIEIGDSGFYQPWLPPLWLAPGASLELRAANRARPMISLWNKNQSGPDSLIVQLSPGSRFILDGLLIVGRDVSIQAAVPSQTMSAAPQPADCSALPSKPAHVVIRHCTLVPGWDLQADCEPGHPAEPSLVIENLDAHVRIEKSILGTIYVTQDEVNTDPTPIEIADSILDGTEADCDQPQCEALGSYPEASRSAPSRLRIAHATLTIKRSTVFGRVFAHAVALAENSIFMGQVVVARSQTGCMRFCYVTPGSRTPRRYNCQPDLVEAPIKNQSSWQTLGDAERQQRLEGERLRVRPQFNSTRYGTPTYCQLANACAEEIRRGADDESEMGAFHDLFQPQRAANLRARIEEYTPAGMDAGIIFAS